MAACLFRASLIQLEEKPQFLVPIRQFYRSTRGSQCGCDIAGIEAGKRIRMNNGCSMVHALQIQIDDVMHGPPMKQSQYLRNRETSSDAPNERCTHRRGR